MTLTVHILEQLHAEDLASATTLVQNSADGPALIELLEMLWHLRIPQGRSLIEPVLQRLAQLRPAH